MTREMARARWVMLDEWPCTSCRHFKSREEGCSLSAGRRCYTWVGISAKITAAPLLRWEPKDA
jgi:hypothetical protein